jgi:hypothetical protein
MSHLDICDIKTAILHQFYLVIVIVRAVVHEREVVAESFPYYVRLWTVDVAFDLNIVADADDEVVELEG